MNQLKVACVQFKPVLGNVKRNLETIANYIQKGKEERIDIMVFPELCVQGYDPKLVETKAEAQNGNSFQFLSEASKFSGIYLVVGLAERSKDKLFNSSVLFYPDGKFGVYRKVHLWSTEAKVFTHGNNYPVFDTEFGKIAMWICYDTRFPEVARIFALKGARIALVPTAWLARDIEHWKLSVCSRALDNFMYVCGADQILLADYHQSQGASIIVNPHGQIISQANLMEEMRISSSIDLNLVDELRELIPILLDRQGSTYSRLYS